MPQGYEPGWLGRLAFGSGYEATEVSADDMKRARRQMAILLPIIFAMPVLAAALVWLTSADAATTIVSAIAAFVLATVVGGIVGYRLDKKQKR